MPPSKKQEKKDDTKKSIITEKNPAKEAPKPKEKREQTNRSVKEPEKNTNTGKVNAEMKNNNNSNNNNVIQTPPKDPPFILSEDRALLTSLQTKMDALHSQLAIKTQLSKCEELNRHLKDARKVERGNLIGSQKTIERYQYYKDEAFKKATDIKRHHNVKMDAVKTAEQLVMARWNLKQPFERSNREHNLSRLNARLQQLQKEFENRQLTLAEEKRQVAEMDGVHQLIVLVTDFHDKWKEVNISDQKEIQRLEENVMKLTQDIQEEKKIEQEYQNRVDNLTKKIEEVRSRIETHQKEKTAMQEQIQATNNQREVVRVKIDKQKAEWVAQREAERKRQEELRVKRQQEKEKYEKRKELLRLIKEAKTPPFQEDVSLCDRLLSFLQQLEKQHSKPVKSTKPSGKKPPNDNMEQKDQPNEQKDQNKDEAANNPPQQQKEAMEEVKPEQPEREVTNDNNTPAESPKAEQAASEPTTAPRDDNKPIELDMEVILSLEQLSLKTPTVLGELRACCEQLKEKKKWFLKLRERIPPLPITDEMKDLMEEMEKEQLEKKKQQQEPKDAEKAENSPAANQPQAEQAQEGTQKASHDKETEKEQSQKVEQPNEGSIERPTAVSPSPENGKEVPEIEQHSESSPEETKDFKRPEIAEEAPKETITATEAVPTAEL